MKKKNRKTSEFWAEIASATGNHSGEEIERLFKNLHSDYQRVKQRLHVSGIGTDDPPTLRNSEELFTVYESFYNLYYPHGGSAVPAVLLTERSCHLLTYV